MGKAESITEQELMNNLHNNSVTNTKATQELINSLETIRHTFLDMYYQDLADGIYTEDSEINRQTIDEINTVEKLTTGILEWVTANQGIVNNILSDQCYPEPEPEEYTIASAFPEPSDPFA